MRLPTLPRVHPRVHAALWTLLALVAHFPLALAGTPPVLLVGPGTLVAVAAAQTGVFWLLRSHPVAA